MPNPVAYAQSCELQITNTHGKPVGGGQATINFVYTFSRKMLKQARLYASSRLIQFCFSVHTHTVKDEELENELINALCSSKEELLIFHEFKLWWSVFDIFYLYRYSRTNLSFFLFMRRTHTSAGRHPIALCTRARWAPQFFALSHSAVAWTASATAQWPPR